MTTNIRHITSEMEDYHEDWFPYIPEIDIRWYLNDRITIKESRSLLDEVLAEDSDIIWEYMELADGSESVLNDLGSLLASAWHDHNTLTGASLKMGVNYSATEMCRILGCSYDSHMVCRVPDLSTIPNQRRRK